MLGWSVPAWGALGGGYTATTLDNASGTASDHLGASVTNLGDLNGDGKDDLAVAMPNAPDPSLSGVSGKVVLVNGGSGGLLGQALTPPLEPSHAGTPTRFGAAVVDLGDIGHCTSTQSCPSVGPQDGTPDFAVSAPGADISSTAQDMGIVYIYDGKTFQVMKRIEIAADDRPAASPGFGKALAPLANADDGTRPDLAIGAPDYDETAETDFAGCGAPDPNTCPKLGRVYIVHGEDIAATAGSVVDTSSPSTAKVQYSDKTTASQQPQLGATLAPLSDVGKCGVPDDFPATDSLCPTNAPSDVPDGYSDLLVSAPGLDVSGNVDAGKVLIVDGKRGLVFGSYSSPDPQQDAGFGSALPSTPPGDLSGDSEPDIYLSAPGQDLGVVDQGRAYALSGDVISPFLIRTFDDPLPATGAKFGAGIAALGDVAGDAPGEVAAGRAGGGPVDILSPCTGTVLQTIPDPDPGSGFGSAIASGELNGDGNLDLAIGASGFDGGKGRLYLMKSNGSPGPAFAGCNPSSGGGGGGGSGSGGGTPAGGSPGGSSGGSGGTTPRSKVRALTKRTISFKGTKKKISIGKLVTLKGRLSARGKKSSCQSHVKVAIERWELAGFFLTIDVAVTKRDGSFATSTRPARTTEYRARVTQTKRCSPAASKKIKIRAKAA
jgi:hypothetical protein